MLQNLLLRSQSLTTSSHAQISTTVQFTRVDQWMLMHCKEPTLEHIHLYSHNLLMLKTTNGRAWEHAAKALPTNHCQLSLLGVTYMPATLSTMISSLSLNLQRLNCYSRFLPLLCTMHKRFFTVDDHTTLSEWEALKGSQGSHHLFCVGGLSDVGGPEILSADCSGLSRKTR